MSKEYPYMTDKAPLAYAEARYRLVRRLERIYSRALDERIRYCQRNGINYLRPLCGKSDDAVSDKLEALMLHAHKEAEMLSLAIARRHGNLSLSA